MSMICKWGHSLGLRLPKPVAEAAGLKAGTEVSVRLLDNGCVLVTPLNGKIVVSPKHGQQRESRRVEEW